MKKIILCLLLACMLCGCMPGADQPPETTVDGGVTESGLTVDETVELESVNPHAFRSSKTRPEVIVVDGRTAAFLTTEYSGGDFSKKQTRVQVFDLYTDTMNTELLLDGEYTSVTASAAVGNIPLINKADSTVLVLDKTLQQVLTFRAEDAEGVLTEDMSTYYYAWGSKLYAQDTAGGAAEAVSVEYELMVDQVLGYDETENILLLSIFEDPYTTDVCVGALDLDTNAFLLLYRDVTGGQIAQGGLVLERLDLEKMYSDVYYCDWTDAQLQMMPGFLLNNADYCTWHVSGTDYIFQVAYDPALKTTIVENRLFRLGDKITACSIHEALDGAEISEIYALPDGNLLAMSTSRRGYQTYLICPEMLEFTPADVTAQQENVLVDTVVTENYAQALQQLQLPEELSQARVTADALEEQYGITILLSSQCQMPASGCDMPITTTDAASLPNEAEAIEAALAELERALELYPADFFSQFRNEAGERGLLVLLVENISHDLNVIGVSYSMGQWYPVAVDITSGQVWNTYCHEFWHATETRIGDLKESALDLAAWEACNPAEFSYSVDMESSYIEDQRFTYFYGDPSEGVYFVDPYAKINSREDRARLMEYVMCSDHYAEDMLKYPAMRAKLQILCDGIRAVFDTTQWDDVHWERFF